MGDSGLLSPNTQFCLKKLQAKQLRIKNILYTFCIDISLNGLPMLLLTLFLFVATAKLLAIKVGIYIEEHILDPNE
jgi:hypothetical protein